VLANLMTPGGRLGTAAVIVAALITTGALVSIILGVSGVGIEKDWERVGAVTVGLAALLGPAGLMMQVQRPTLGGFLAVLGSIAAFLLHMWMIISFLIIPATIYIAVRRGRHFSGSLRGAVLS
jgi:hypothetical protein